MTLSFVTHTQVDIANKILDYLKEHNYWHDTHHLRRMLDVGREEHTNFRTFLKRMERGGLLRHKGSKTFEWRINVESWDRGNPFRNVKPIQYGGSPPVPTLPPPTPPEKPSSVVSDDVLQKLRARVTVLESDVAEAKQDVEQANLAIAALVDKLAEVKKVQDSHVKTLVLKHYDGKVVKLRNKILPAAYKEVLDLARCRRNVLLVGPAGCGKTYLAKLVADSLDLPFYKVGGSGGLQEHHLLGRVRPNLTGGKDKFVTTQFLEAYEKGGVCLIDELDGADQNVLLALNPALDTSGDLPIPNRGDVAKKHKDFVCIATANTIGHGANRMYSGRNQLDEATLDRFRIGFVECTYDETVEAAVCPDNELREKFQKIRKKIEATGLRRIVSTRNLEDYYIMTQKADWTVDYCVERFFRGWTPEEKGKILPL